MDFVTDYVIVDIETTGLDKETCEIIEIGALKVVNGEIVDSFSTLIKPSSIIEENITNLTGITNEMVKDAPSIYEVLVSFKEFIGSNILVAHNARFDYGFLSVNFLKHLSCRLSNRYIDTLYLSRKYLPNLENHKLGTLAKHFGVDYLGAHRGLRDCEITKEVYDKLANIVQINV